MILPADLSPETAAWMRMQMTIAAARAVEPLQAEIKSVSEWADGLFVVIANMLHVLLREMPELATGIEPHWRQAADDFARMEADGVHVMPGVAPELLEARKMLYRMFDLEGLWPKADPVPRRARGNSSA